MIYFDANYLVRLYFEDRGFDRVRELASSDHLTCALHGQAEVLAAFHRKFREGAISTANHRTLLEEFKRDNRLGAIAWLPLGPEVLEKVAEVYSKLASRIFLRSGDALHLATAATHGLKIIYSHDAHVLSAASHFGLTPRNVIE